VRKTARKTKEAGIGHITLTDDEIKQPLNPAAIEARLETIEDWIM
jgi:hypothetical protein